MLKGMNERLLLLSLLPFLLAADVYKTESEDGTVEYSDQSQDRSEKMELLPLSTVKPPSISAPEKIQSVKSASPSVSDQSIQIQHPGEDTAIRSNNGDLHIRLRLTPARMKGNQHIELELDKKRLDKSFQQTQIRLQNIARGTHVLQAFLVDKNGAVLARTAEIRFHLLRHSILTPP